ncbi:MAG: carbamoyltransferase HypF [Marinilabiliales bacterium]
MKTIKIKIEGLVQGVGFRPFIYRMAITNNIKGWVDNRTDGVYIVAKGTNNNLNNFLNDIKTKSPPASVIEKITTKDSPNQDFTDFTILKSKDNTDNTTRISPDIAVCNDCLNDMKLQKNRLNYPFINCTNCGPRFTIIKALPYDRASTTMSVFEMCNECNDEYNNVLDRRFHAQPIACKICGPEYKLHYQNSQINDFDQIISIVSNLVLSGKIITIKGLGGFFITCNALDENAVSKLRKSKLREGKPFAVMFPDIELIKEFCHINKLEEDELLSYRRPIMILKSKKSLAQSVSNGFNTIGCFLPYMPFHYLLFEKTGRIPIVMTSGNISNEPIVRTNNEAIDKLMPVSDALITYNREIYNRVDDSVLFSTWEKTHFIRRARGYVPNPINLNINVNNIIATGSELVNTFCIGKNNQAILSQHIGDLKNLDTLNFYTESLNRFINLFRIQPKLYAHDIHPEYLSTKYAKDQKLPVIEIQHHHAHIASVMAEHGLDEKIIGIAFDGTGLGTDRKIWGGEFFISDLLSFERVFHFDYLPIPGGDSATKEPWKTGLSLLYKVFGNDLWNIDIPFVKNLNKNKAGIIINAIDKNLNCPESSSTGRLFDAISAILNICTMADFHAEAPMRLENIITEAIENQYSYEIKTDSISFNNMVKEIVYDLKSNIPVNEISAKFHNTIISVIINISLFLRAKYNINKVALSGGSFQNRYLLNRTVKELSQKDFIVFTNEKVPANDGGISLGQLVIAAKNLQLNKL